MNYETLFNNSWRGFYGLSSTEKDFIRLSKAVTYNDFLNEAIILKKLELGKLGGTPFREPSTFYGSFQDSYNHDDYRDAAARYASTHYWSYRQFKNDLVKDQKPIPKGLEDPEVKLWTIINESSELEPWAWPMVQLCDRFYNSIQSNELPIIHNIFNKYIELGFTEEEFLKSINKIRLLTRY